MAAKLSMVVVGLDFLAAAWGVRCWRYAPTAKSFWTLLRVAQGAVVVQVAWLTVVLMVGDRGLDLNALYVTLPLLVALLAEQLRLESTRSVLGARGLESGADVGALPPSQQDAVVAAIMRREVGVMAVSAFVVCALALRALQTGGI